MDGRQIDPQIDLMLRLMDSAYDSKSWHGPNLRGSIRGLDSERAAWRPAPERHNVWEIVLHTAYWKYVVRRRLLGEKRGSCPLKGSNWFARPEVLSDSAWRADVAILEETHRSLRAAVAELTAERLHETPKGSTVSNFMLVSGAAAHDVYHAGQIQLLKRLMGTSEE